MIRWLRALLAPLALSFGLLVFLGSPAHASILDPCSPTAPTPSVQDGSIQGTFDSGPAPAGTSLYDKYGEGPGWSQYDLGCLGSAGHFSGDIDTTIGNAFYAGAKGLVALSQGLTRLVSPPRFLGGLDNLIRSGTNAFDHTIWEYLLPPSLLILGLLIIVKGHRQLLSGAAWAVGWAVLVIAMVSFVTRYPIYASQLADNTQTTVIGGIDSALSPGQGSVTAATGTLEVDGVLDPFWKQGEFGSSTSQTAQKYGDRMFGDTAQNWGQPVTDATTSAKETDFQKAASEIKATDPQAYQAVVGDAGGRTSAGFFALVAAFITTMFRIVADLLVVASLLIIRLIVVLLPAIAVIGIHQRTRQVVLGSLLAGGAALVNAVVFSVGASINTFAVSTLLSPASQLPTWVALLLSAAVAYLLWHLMKPFRRLTQMANAGLSPIHQMAQDIRHMPGHALQLAGYGMGAAKVGMAAATYLAAHRAADNTGHIDDRLADERTKSSSQDEPQSLPEDWSRDEPSPPALATPRPQRELDSPGRQVIDVHDVPHRPSDSPWARPMPASPDEAEPEAPEAPDEAEEPQTLTEEHTAPELEPEEPAAEEPELHSVPEPSEEETA